MPRPPGDPYWSRLVILLVQSSGSSAADVMLCWRKTNRGPVAQLGARLHGMEEVEGSNPSRSTTVLPYSRLESVL